MARRAFGAVLVALVLYPFGAPDVAGPPPCPMEDSQPPWPCHWDAQHRGNGLGHSFTWPGSR